MIRLYGPLNSRARRCLWMLEELAIPYEHVPMDDLSREQRREKISKVALTGKAPAMEDGSLKLFESAAINLYLASKYDDRELWPASQADRARVMQWAFFAMTELEPPIATLFMQKFVHTGKNHSEAAVKAAKRTLAGPLETLDKQLKKRSYLLSDQFTAADLLCVSVLDMLGRLEFGFEPWPNVHKWVVSCTSRPAYERAGGSG